jgi:DNA-directed RNA polymerase specialized sigma24 family protein
MSVMMIESLTTTALEIGETTTQDSATPEVFDASEADDSSETLPKEGVTEEASTTVPGADPDLWLYRDRTIALLRRYMRLAVEVGRLPSILGREFFRTRVTSYHTQTFEDSVIFVQDIERCLDQLDAADKAVIGLIVLEDHTQAEAARLLRCTERTIRRQYPETLDRMSAIFLEREILARLPAKESISPEACQEGKNGEFPASDSSEGENNS